MIPAYIDLFNSFTVFNHSVVGSEHGSTVAAESAMDIPDPYPACHPYANRPNITSIQAGVVEATRIYSDIVICDAICREVLVCNQSRAGHRRVALFDTRPRARCQERSARTTSYQGVRLDPK
jgi:hypothetical protein